MVLIEAIFEYNSAKYETNFTTFLLLLEIIWALNLIKRFRQYFNWIIALPC